MEKDVYWEGENVSKIQDASKIGKFGFSPFAISFSIISSSEIIRGDKVY